MLLKNTFNKIQEILNRQDRSAQAIKNIMWGGGIKAVSVIIPLIQVPLLLGYWDNVVYGIWLTLASIINWISYFDVGLTHGLRNRFAEAKANNNTELAKRYVSTTYATLFAIFGSLSVVLVVINFFLNWTGILNVDLDINDELRAVFFVIIITNCLQFILKVYPTILLADQRPALSYGIHTIGQILVLLTLLILVRFDNIPLHIFALVITGIPCLVILLFSIIAFKGRYSSYSPSIKSIDKSLIRNILGLGIKFFIIQIDLLIIFQMSNIIISRVLGPSNVTTFNIANTYYYAFFMVFSIIITPYWSAFTDAYTRGDYTWMNKVFRNLKMIWRYSIVVMLLMVLLSEVFFHIWVGDQVSIPLGLSIAFGVYVLIMSLANIHMFILNGIGKVYIQLIIYTAFALISIPTLVYTGKLFGLVGIVIVLTTVYACQAIFGEIQIRKILNKSQYGAWDK